MQTNAQTLGRHAEAPTRLEVHKRVWSEKSGKVTPAEFHTGRSQLRTTVYVYVMYIYAACVSRLSLFVFTALIVSQKSKENTTKSKKWCYTVWMKMNWSSLLFGVLIRSNRVIRWNLVGLHVDVNFFSRCSTKGSSRGSDLSWILGPAQKNTGSYNSHNATQ